MSWVRVTDVKVKDKKGIVHTGFPMNAFLKENLDGVPKFLSKGYDCVIIVSGHGKVRIGKSTMAKQVGYYLAWLLAGGKTKCHQEIVNGKNKWIVDKIIKPKREMHYDLHENVSFAAEQMTDQAIRLNRKYGNNQIVLYDEGRQGLDSARAMESVNKGMQDFFQECGVMGNIIIIVLPNFFKLHEDYAVARSMALIDVHADERFNRGFFKFYNDLQKEKLFFFGKKKIGITAKYYSASANFDGKFSDWDPFDRKEYDKLKKQALAKKRKSRIQQKFKKQRDSAFYLLKTRADMSSVDIANNISVISGQKLSERIVRYSIANITHEKVESID